MPALSRFTTVLRLFSETRDAWTVLAMSDALEVPASSVYRTVRELVAEGFLEPSANATYRLGAAFVEFDRLTRLTDPLMQMGKPILQEVVRQAQIVCVGLLARLYHETVMCIADAAVPGATFHPSYERGRPMPLMLGATSRVILAQLPARRLKRLWEKETLARRTRHKQFEELRHHLAAVRRAGYAITRGEIDKGLVGIAVPLVASTSGATASLSLVVEAKILDRALEHRLVLLLISSAQMLSEDLSPAKKLASGR